MERNAGVRFFAANPGQRLTARFLDGGVRLASGSGGTWSGTLSLTVPTGETKTTPAASGSRVEYRHSGGITEWFDNKPAGLEHGFTLARRPANAPAGEMLRLPLTIEGLRARTAASPDSEAQNDDAITLEDPATGAAVLRYSSLKVWDATGRSLPARMEAAGSRLTLLFADSGAAYPITVDPLITSQEWKTHPAFAGDGSAADQFGAAAALAGDTALIGAPLDATAAGEIAGSVHVFVRSGPEWTRQARLTAPDAIYGGLFGVSVAFSGETAVIGAPAISANTFDPGSAHVFVRTGTVWTPQAKLTPSNPNSEEFGFSVALSGDTAVVGAQSENTGLFVDAGNAYVFVRDGAQWTQQARLSAQAPAYGQYFGRSVALSGNTLLAGGHMVAKNAPGKVHVFVRNGTAWTLQKILIASDWDSNDRFGDRVALDGNTAVIGTPGDDFMTGSAYVFVRNGTSWSQQAKLTAEDRAFEDAFGGAVAISGDTILAAAAGDDTPGGADAGSVWVFARSGTVWTRQTQLLLSGSAAYGKFGVAVALDGDTALAGGDQTNTGKAWVFTRSGTAWSATAHLSAGDSASDDAFGWSVALAGDTAIVGSHQADSAAAGDAGAAYVFVRSGEQWSFQARLAADDAGAHDYFGWSVAVSGDTALIGAFYDTTATGLNAGSAYVFTRSGTAWTQQAKLAPADPGINHFFGYAVALDGETALVSKSRPDNFSGAVGVYAFVRSAGAWTQQAKLPGTATDNFGTSLDLEGDTALVGAPGMSPASKGGALVFVRSGTAWTQQGQLVGTDALSAGQLGYSVALSGNTALLGGPGSIFAGSDSARAYVFVRNGTAWAQEAKLTLPNSPSLTTFGTSVALAGDMAVIGAPQEDNAAGRAYVFVRKGTAWTNEKTLSAADPSTGDTFAQSLALDAGTLLAGAPGDDTLPSPAEDLQSNHGSLYVLRLRRSPTALSGPPDGLTASGVSLHAFVNGFWETTVVRFDYGPTTGYGSQQSLTLSSGQGALPADAALTGLLPGTLYHYQITAANATGAEILTDATFTTLTLFQEWRRQYFGSPANTGPAANTADPDGDGFVNLLEYALHGNPLASDSPGPVLTSAGDNLEFIYTRNKAAADVLKTVTWTADPAIGPWSSTGVTQSVIHDDGTVETVRALIPAGTLRRFVRLEVTAP